MFGKVTDDSFTNIFDLSLDGEDNSKLFGANCSLYNNLVVRDSNPTTLFGNNSKIQNHHHQSSTSSSPLSSRRDFSASPTISTPSSSSSLPLEQAFSFSGALNLENPKSSNSSSDSSSASSSSSSTNANAAKQVNTNRYKTELCRPFAEHGACKYGEKCQFAHGQPELRTVSRHPKYKTDLCRTYHSVGFCPYGPRCHFIHNLDEVVQAPPTRQSQAKPTAAVGSGRTSTNDQSLKPLPLFDSNAHLPFHHQSFQKRAPAVPAVKTPAADAVPTWSPLQSSFQLANSRLPVFSTLSE